MNWKDWLKWQEDNNYKALDFMKDLSWIREDKYGFGDHNYCRAGP